MEITKKIFGTTGEGAQAYLYTLTNSKGASVTATNFGCRIVGIKVPDREGKLRDVTLGYDTLAEYEHDGSYFGAAVGRYANRIGKGKFTLDGVEYQLPLNDGPNHLHGGVKGFHFCVWDAKILDDAVRFTHVFPDGDEGYPGTLAMTVEYRWTEDNELSISYRATTDADTVINVTNHSFFNLSGEDADTALDLVLAINAEQFTEADENTLVTGKIADVEGTPLDFRKPKAIGQDIHAGSEHLRYTNTYDHNFILSGGGAGLTEAAVLYSERTGICMTCFTDQPGLQLFVTPKSPAEHGKGGKTYPAYGSVCLESQHYPDSPNQPEFPSTLLTPEKPFASKTIYHFSVRK